MNTATIIVPSDMALMVREIERSYQQYLNEYRIPDDHKIIVNFSAGKDSTATLTIASHLFGDKVQGVMADTDNEHSSTIEYAHNIHEQIGCAPVEVVKRIYTQANFDKRRAAINKNWRKRQVIKMGAYRGITMPSLARTDTKFASAWRQTAARWGIEYETPLDAALSVMKPSGNSFLDACLLHGKFPMLRDRFCTDELKIQIVYDAVLAPQIDDGDVIVQWSGVRADESTKRASYVRFEPDRRNDKYLYNFLPIHSWTATDVFALHKYFGINPNPLYLQGADRVGCMNCVLCSKSEIAETAARWPEYIDKHRAWELMVRLTSRWVHWMSVGTFSQQWMRKFTHSKLGSAVQFYGLTPPAQHIDWSAFYGTRGGMGAPSVDDVVEWSKTGRGGQVYDLVVASLDTNVCSSKYGLCE
ncbi:phosphoadenosine phosphosulfate reductase domain-containing protein [Xenorhabdus bovienii]|uniref:phosphoadenosine phosphosulfate reductase domain-containing protein n=1 Tax=Xenorhabdus bovienii TaxID=40576 RepID=UPI0030B9DF75